MKKYIGVKQIEAKRMSARLASVSLGREVDTTNAAMSESGESGYPGYLVQYPDGYQSWSPEKQFEEAYRPTYGLSFGFAIEAAKKGLKIARKGWNGKGIFVFLVRMGDITINEDRGPDLLETFLAINTLGLQTDNEDAPKTIVPWMASQTDMLSDDWQVIES